MKKAIIAIVSIVGIIFLGLIILIVIYLSPGIKELSKRVSSYEQLLIDFALDDYELEVVESKTKEPSFHGDGNELYKVRISKDEAEKVEKMMKKSWNKGKLSKEVDLIMYGGEDEDTEYGYNFAEEVNLPRIDNGYWKLINENEGSLLDNMFDFKLAIYDIENRYIYLFENYM